MINLAELQKEMRNMDPMALNHDMLDVWIIDFARIEKMYHVDLRSRGISVHLDSRFGCLGWIWTAVTRFDGSVYDVSSCAIFTVCPKFSGAGSGEM